MIPAENSRCISMDALRIFANGAIPDSVRREAGQNIPEIWRIGGRDSMGPTAVVASEPYKNRFSLLYVYSENQGNLEFRLGIVGACLCFSAGSRVGETIRKA
jgi:hypothetical protein